MYCKTLLPLAACFIAWPAAHAGVGAKFDCAAYEVVLGARSTLSNGAATQVGKYYYTAAFPTETENWNKFVLEDAWRQHAKKTLPRTKGTELITSCDFSERYTARAGTNISLGNRGNAGVWHYALEWNTISSGGQEVPFTPPWGDHFVKAIARDKAYFQCAVILQPERLTYERYDQGASAQKTKMFETSMKDINAATHAFGQWANALPARHEWVCSTAITAEGATAGINGFMNKYKLGIPVTGADWVPQVQYATAKPTGGKASLPALTIEGPSKSDRDHAAATKAREEKAKVDAKKAEMDQAVRDAASKAQYDALAADAAKAKAKAKAERAEALKECAAKGIPAAKCPARASAQ